MGETRAMEATLTTIRDEEELRRLLGEPSDLVRAKVGDRLNELTRQFASPAMLVPGQTPDAWSDYLSGRLIEGDRIVSRLFAEVAK